MEYTILNTNKYSVTEFKIFVLFLKDRLKFFSSVCVQDGMLIYFGEKNSRGHLLNMFVQKVARGNAVQMFSNFPAKSLSI